MTSNRVTRAVAALCATLTVGLAGTTASAQVPGLPLPPLPLPGMPPAQPAPGAPPQAPPPGQPGAYPPGYVPPQPGYPYGPPQQGAPAPGYGGPGYGGPGYGGPGYGGPNPYPPPPAVPQTSTTLELGYLYATAATYGLGTGVWIDSEAKLCEPKCDPGLVVIAPLLLGTVAPVGVFLADRFAYAHGMPAGLPSSIATGMWIGAGQGLGIATYQYVHAKEGEEWGFRGLARASFIGSTVGGLAGAGLHYAIQPAPQSNMLLLSSVFWGTSIGAMFGGGASPTRADWSRTNDDVWLGGEIGYNVALAGAVTASIWWTPTWSQLGWMWGGFGLGSVASLPVYLLYAAADDADPRRGLVVQGVTSTIGLGLGAIFSRQRGPATAETERDGGILQASARRPVSFGGASLMPVERGLGVQAFGALW